MSRFFDYIFISLECSARSARSAATAGEKLFAQQALCSVCMCAYLTLTDDDMFTLKINPKT